MSESNHTTAAIIGGIATVLAAIIPIAIYYDPNSGPEPPSVVNAGSALDGLAHSCEAWDMGSCDQLFVQAPIGSDYELLGGTCGGLVDEISSTTCVELSGLVMDELANECTDGDMTSCDALYLISPYDSNYEDYAATCGARFDYWVDSCEAQA